MAGQSQCELCGRTLADAYKGSVCPMCKQEFEALRSKQIKCTAPQAVPVESRVAPRSDDRFVSLGTATRTVGPAPDPLPETATGASSAPPPATPRKLSRQTACVYWTIILVGGFFLVMSAVTIIQEEVFDARRRSEPGYSGTGYRAQSAAQLWAEFHDNEIAANAKWLDKKVTVKGEIDSVKYQDGRAYIMLDGNGITRGVQCAFPAWDESAFVKLKSGQNVRVAGYVAGTCEAGAVVLLDSELVD